MASNEGARQRRPGIPVPSQQSKDKKRELSEAEAVAKASGGWIRSFFIALTITIVTPILVLILWPSPIKPAEMTGLSEPPELTGALAPNNVLIYSERLYRDKLAGPESIVVHGDHIYTGTEDGWVNDIHEGVVHKLVRFGKEPCGGYENENTCGRPLGIRMDKEGLLVVVDAYHGLFRVNPQTGDYTTLYSTKVPVSGKVARFLNDLDIGPDGKIYFTDSSTKWTRNQFPMVLWEMAGTGRLLMYDPVTEKTTQLTGGLVFPNGVQLTKDKSAVLVVELAKSRILKFDLKSKKTSIWADNLPGTPDNIRYCSASDTYWVGMAFIRQRGKPALLDFLAPRPWLRGIIAKVASIRNLLAVKKYLSSADTCAMAIELNDKGVIISSIHDNKGEVIDSVSEVAVVDGVMYFGSFHAKYIGRLNRKMVPKV